MTGAQLVPAASEADWLEARRAGVTASEIASLMGIAPDGWETPFSLYQRKTGTLPAAMDADRLRLGRFLEPFVSELFTERHPEFYVAGDGRQLWASIARPWQMATPDRFVSEICRIIGHCTCAYPETGAERIHEPHCGLEPGDVVGVLECKTSGTFDGWGPDGSDDIPVYYRAQTLWQMDVLGVSTGYVGCVFLPGGQFRVYELAMDDAARQDLELMRAEAESFLACVERRIEPEPDWRPATGLALRHLHPSLTDTEVRIPRALAARWNAARKAEKAAQRRKKAAEHLIRQRMGSAARAVIPGLDGPALVATRQVYDVREHVRSASVTDKLVAPRGSGNG